MRWIATLVLCLSCVGCSTLDRLFRNSPLQLSGDETGANRVSVWPLVYKNGDRVAILWPIYDQDKQGFAFRPFITNDGSTWEILPPIFSYDTASQDWYFLNAYKFGKYHGLFPIYDHGWINHIGPIVWDEDEQGNITGGGLFPISYLGPGFNYVGPAWWSHDENGYVNRGGLFPLAYVSPTFNYAGPVFWCKDGESGEMIGGGLFPVAWLGRTTAYVGPFWWNRDDDGELKSGGLFPVTYISPNFSHLGPIWWNRDDEGAMTGGGLFPLADFSEGFNHVGPLYWVRNEAGEIESSGLLPLAYFSNDFNLAGPVFWWKNEAGEVERSGLFPLAYFGTNFNMVGPALWWTDDNGKLLHGGVLPLAYFGPDSGVAGLVWWTKDALGLFPFATLTDSFSYAGPVWWHKNEADEVNAGGLFPLADFSEGFNHVGPVFWFKNEKGEIESSGMFPLACYGENLNYTGPVYWNRNADGETTSGGLFPVAHIGDGFSYVGPAWWNHRTDAEGNPVVSSYGLFPLTTISDGFSHVGPVFWNHHPDGALKYLYFLPLAGYSATPEGQQTFISPLGATRYDANGDLEWCNILGPLFHYGRTREGGSFLAVTPFFTMREDENSSRWDVWPLVGHNVVRNPDGSLKWESTSALGGLVKFEGRDGVERARGFPLFTYRSAEGGELTLIDYISLFGYHNRGDQGASAHFLTPLVFNYRSDGDAYKWHSLLGSVSYEQEGEDSEFNLLWFLYNQKITGTETTRDIFPFITLDTGVENAGFSFLWHLFSWQRKGDKVGGHFLFIPWGDT